MVLYMIEIIRTYYSVIQKLIKVVHLIFLENSYSDIKSQKGFPKKRIPKSISNVGIVYLCRRNEPRIWVPQTGQHLLNDIMSPRPCLDVAINKVLFPLL